MNRIIKINTASILGIFIAGLVVLAAILLSRTESAKASPSTLTASYMTKGGGSSTGTAVGTTTEGVTYLAAGATTTAPFATYESNIMAVDVAMTASTSLGRLVLTYDVSNDIASCDTDPNKCTWSIAYIATTTASVNGVNTITIASTSPVYTFEPDGQLNATTSLTVPFNSSAYRFIRVKANCTLSACALWIRGTRVSQL